VEPRDRAANLAFFGAAAVAWVAVAIVVMNRDPRLDPGAGLLGAGLMGLAVGLTAVPLFWLAVFARHRRIAYRGDWARALRRSSWVGLLVLAFVVLRLQGAFQLPIAVFILVMVLVAESTLSAER
jgi:hypothetical protein